MPRVKGVLEGYRGDFLLKRTITGIVGIIIAAFIITIGNELFFGATSLLALVAWKEYNAAFKNIDIPTPLITGGIIVATLLCASFFCPKDGMIGVIMLGSLILFLGSLIHFDKGGFNTASISVAGFIYIGLSFSHLILLRFYEPQNMIETILGNFTMGEALIWLMFIGTWASDSFAYFTGRAMGKQPLCEDISPKKTVEGFVGAVIGTTLLVFIIGHFFFGFNFLLMTPLGIVLAIFGAIGDLVESTLKRYAKVKDSGNLIPGHGGVLDRFDSIMFNAPLVYYFAVFFLK